MSSGRRDQIDLVWFSEVQWDFLSTRKQRLLQRFSSRWRILFIEPYALGRPAHWLPVRRGNVTVVTVPFLKTVPYRIGRLLDRFLDATFAGSASSLVMQLLGNRKTNQDEIDEIKRIISDMEQNQQP